MATKKTLEEILADYLERFTITKTLNLLEMIKTKNSKQEFTKCICSAFDLEGGWGKSINGKSKTQVTSVLCFAAQAKMSSVFPDFYNCNRVSDKSHNVNPCFYCYSFCANKMLYDTTEEGSKIKLARKKTIKKE